MRIQEELRISKPLDPGQELPLSLLLTREYVSRLLDERLFRPEGITDQQYNVLRILKGGPPEGYLIRDIKGRMVVRNADVPRLVDRMVARGLVERTVDSADRRGHRVRITPKGLVLEARITGPQKDLSRFLLGLLSEEETRVLLTLLERVRDGIRASLAPSAEG